MIGAIAAAYGRRHGDGSSTAAADRAGPGAPVVSPPVDLDGAGWTLAHELRLRGVSATAAEGGSDDLVEVLLAAGVAVRTRRSIVLTAEGREHHARWARVPPGSPEETAVRGAHERFLPLNRELLSVCGAWQVRPGGVPNDHADARYDWAVIDRLHGLDERAAPVLRRLGQAVPRFAPYRSRLRAALARVEEGDREWVTSPRLDSYHTVWMQLHEDLLLALGLDRGQEPEVIAAPAPGRGPAPGR